MITVCLTCGLLLPEDVNECPLCEQSHIGIYDDEDDELI